MSTFAFGTYRVSDRDPMHIEALKEAIEAGVTLIDTSTNYTDGGAERAIAKALSFFDDDIRKNIKIVSKFGYIQGSNLQTHKTKPYDEVVEFSENCYHSISKTFLQEQLTKSLERLELDNIDCYLIHNPEYYIYDAIKKEMPRDAMLDTMYERIYEAFVALEQEVLDGRINSYGISSNSFSKSSNDAEFLPYEDLITLAQKAAKTAGAHEHHFSTVEMPINLLETDGLKCAAWAKKNGLRVLSNRPLNAQHNQLMYRLADYDEPKEYYHALNELLDICDNKQLKVLYNLVEQMDANKHKFGWIGDYDSFLFTQILPHIKNSIEKMPEDVLEVMLRYVDTFIVSYRKMVAYECSKATKVQLKEYFKDCDKSMQECALKYLQNQNDIDYVIVGMRKPTYVQEVVSLIS